MALCSEYVEQAENKSHGAPTPRTPKTGEGKQYNLVGDYTTGFFGDVRYRAPEVILGKAYNYMADSWTFGVILYFLLTKELPFDYDKSCDGFVDGRPTQQQ